MAPDEGWGGPKPPSSNPATGADWTPRELRIGEVYGARSFEVTPDGHLMGVTYNKIWSPGINVSECWKVTGWEVPGVGISTRYPMAKYEPRLTGKVYEWGGEKKPEIKQDLVGYAWLVDGVEGYVTERPTPVYGTTDTAHTVATCECGWHGYLRGSLNFAIRRNVINGIVRASGLVRLCERGFRASHAEIVALYLPQTQPEWVGDLAPIGADEPGLRAGFLRSKVIDTDRAPKIRVQYPDVPIYTDLDEMLEHHPTEPPRGAA